MYDLIIIGAGPAGLTAGIYATRYKLNNLVIGKVLGGTIINAHNMANFPGIKSISGQKWAADTAEQLKALGGELILEGVTKISKNEVFKVTTEGGQEYESQALIIATGSQRRELGIPGEKELLGHGVSYCTTCDLPFFKNKTVAIIGGSDAAVTGAIQAANLANKVYIIYRRDKLRAEAIWIDQVLKNPKIEIIYNTNLTKIVANSESGISKVIGVELYNPFKDNKLLALDGVFIEIGGVPTTALAQVLGVNLDEQGFIKVNENKETNVAGVFSAGDITSSGKQLQQVITACAEGARAAASAFKLIKGQKAPQILGI